MQVDKDEGNRDLDLHTRGMVAMCSMCMGCKGGVTCGRNGVQRGDGRGGGRTGQRGEGSLLVL